MILLWVQRRVRRLLVIDLFNGTASGSAIGTDFFANIENFISGSGPGNTFVSDSTSSTFNGFGSIDWVDYSHATAAISANFATNVVTGYGTDTLSSIENIIGGDFNDTFISDNLATNNTVIGGLGLDTLSYVNSTTSSITFNISTGTITGLGTDIVTSIEKYIGGSTNDTFNASGAAGNQTFDGGGGTADVLNYSTETTALTIDLFNGTATGANIGTDTLLNIENAIGGSGSNTFVSNSSGNAFTGGASSDWVSYANTTSNITVTMATGTVTGDGTDVLTSVENILTGSGTDTVLSDNTTTDNTFNLGGGTSDRISYAASTVAILANLATGTITGRGTDIVFGVENVTGSSLNDTFIADNNDTYINSFDGAVGADTIDYSGNSASSFITARMDLGTISTNNQTFTDNISNIEIVIGTAGDDTMVSGAGNDTFTAGLGTDLLSFAGSTAAATFNINAGTATATGKGTDTYTGVESFLGTTLNDTFTASGAAGNQTFDGGAGTADVVNYSTETTALTIDLFNGTATGANIGTDTLINIENAVGGSGANTFVSNSSNNTFTGGASIDTVDYSNTTSNIIATMTTGTVTGNGTDILTSIERVITGSGNDTMISGAGNDTFIAGLGTDLLSYASSGTLGITFNINAGTATGQGSDAFSGVESFLGGTVADTFNASGAAGNQTFDGSSGTDVIDYSTETTALTIDLFNGTATGANIGTDTVLNIENAIGGSGSNTFVSNSSGNAFTGGASSDWVSYANTTSNITVTMATGLVTGDGADVLTSVENIITSSGNDTVLSDNTTTDNTFNLGGGTSDRISYAASTVGIFANLATGTITGRGTDLVFGVENLTGSSSNDTFIADNNDTYINSFDGAGGADIIDYSGNSATNFITARMDLGTISTNNQTFTDNITNIEIVIGTAGNDTMVSGAGNDTFTAGLGTDLLSFAGSTAVVTFNISAGTATATGKGTDSYTGVESFIGSTLADTFNAGAAAGNQTFDGGAGIDTVSYSTDTTGVTIDLFANTATGSAIDTDTLVNIENATGGTGNDTLVSNAGNNTFIGGAGEDFVSYANATTGVTVNFSTNTITGDGTDSITFIEHAIGSAFDDTFINANTTANNTYIGGSGIDTVSYASSGSIMTVHLDTGTITGRGTDIVSGVENVIGGTAADQFFGDGNDNVFTGGLGNDTYTGGAGIDTVSYAGGTSVSVSLISGAGSSTGLGSGTDSFVSGIERIIGSDVADTFIGGTGDQTFAGGLGNDTITGGADNDTVDYSGSSSAVTVDLTIGTATGEGTDVLTTLENIIGSSLNDTLTGSLLANTISGGGGADLLIGGGGADFLFGNTGDDILRYENTLTTFDGGLGNDTLQLSAGLSLDLTSLPDAQFVDLESIDLATDTLANSLTLSLNDVLSFSNTTDTLVIDGTASDSVASTDTWVAGGTQIIGSNNYQIYTSSSATLYVDTDINQLGILL